MNIRIIILAILFSLISVFCADNSEVYVKKAENYYNSHNFNEAKKYYNKALKEGYENPEIYLKLGNTEFFLNNYQEAENYYKEYISKVPEDYRGYINLGNCLLTLESYQEALDKLLKAEKLNPGYSETLKRIGYTYKLLRKDSLSIIYAEKALEQKPDDAQIYNLIGSIYYDNRLEFEKAKEYYSKALELDSSNAEIFYNLANSYRALGKFDSAITYFDKALEFNVQLPKIYNNKGLTYKQKGELEKAKECFLKGLEIDSSAFFLKTNLRHTEREIEKKKQENK